MQAISVKKLKEINAPGLQDHVEFRASFMQLMLLFVQTRFTSVSVLCVPKYWSDCLCVAIQIMLSIDPDIKFDAIEERHGCLNMAYVASVGKYEIIKDMVADAQVRIDEIVQARIKKHLRSGDGVP